MKVIYMGTPDFAVGPLEAIIQAGHQVSVVVTQPDKPKGRSKELIPSPVKQCAMDHGIPVLTPARIKTEEAVRELAQYPADIGVVAAFGQILSEEILSMPKFGCINIHASLLPKYRGAAPIQWSIIEGEAETGVTIMQMDKGLDTGDILFQEKVPILPEETGESLFDKLAATGASLIVDALEKIEKGEVSPIKQEEEKSSYAKMLKKETGRIDFSKSAVELERLVRGLYPWPSAYTFYQGKQLKIWKSEADLSISGQPGKVERVTKDAVYVGTKEGCLVIKELQLEGKKRMSAKEFLLGKSLEAGEMLG
ncbi:MAG: methionyl-tRNA formyltransferase [Lachnospiraceae bacterium]|nr:methionyl-tRNA formyltransferase [Lachnospiraceae bacterium]